MLDPQAAEAVRARLEGLPRTVTLHVFTREDRLVIPGRDPAPMVRETVALMEELAGLSERVRVQVHDLDVDPASAQRFGIARAPAVVPVADDGSEDGADYGIRFYGPPLGYEFASLIDAIERVAAGPAELEPAVAELLGRLEDPVHLQIFTTPTCPHCPRAVRCGVDFAVAKETVRVDVIEVSHYPMLARRYAVMAVPKVVIDDRYAFEGALPPEQFARAIVEAAGGEGGG